MPHTLFHAAITASRHSEGQSRGKANSPKREEGAQKPSQAGIPAPPARPALPRFYNQHALSTAAHSSFPAMSFTVVTTAVVTIGIIAIVTSPL
jgi:hypothetical protein